MSPKEPEGHEDCLKLNIYTPLVNDKKLPVLVWFAVGAFLVTTAPAPSGLRTGEMVHVEVNSRLGPLGYLCIQGTQVLAQWHSYSVHIIVQSLRKDKL